MTREGHNFIKEISDAYQALEQVPQLQARIKELEQALEGRAHQVQNLELRLIDLKNDQDALYAKLRSVEVERDDASFRNLEAEDRFTVLKHLVGGAMGAMAEALAALEPAPKVEEVKAPALGESSPSLSNVETISTESQVSTGSSKPIESGEIQGQSAASPTVPSPFGNPSQIVTSHVVETSSDVAPKTTAEGQSANPPTPTTPLVGEPASPQSSQPSSAQITDDEAIHGPFFGKRYYDWPRPVSLSDWLAGGGTQANYDWKPESQFNRASQYS